MCFLSWRGKFSEVDFAFGAFSAFQTLQENISLFLLFPFLQSHAFHKLFQSLQIFLQALKMLTEGLFFLESEQLARSDAVGVGMASFCQEKVRKHNTSVLWSLILFLSYFPQLFLVRCVVKALCSGTSLKTISPSPCPELSYALLLPPRARSCAEGF